MWNSEIKLRAMDLDDNRTLGNVLDRIEDGCRRLAIAIQEREAGAARIAHLLGGLLSDAHSAYQRLSDTLVPDAPLLRVAENALYVKHTTVLALLEEMKAGEMPDELSEPAKAIHMRVARLANKRWETNGKAECRTSSSARSHRS
jgi:hypothetical protein